MKKRIILRNYIVLALDISYSMRKVRQEAINAYNAMVKTIRERSGAEGQLTYVSLVTFGAGSQVATYPSDVRNLKPMTLEEYNPNDDATALFDGLGLAIETADEADSGDTDTSFVVILVSDGGENNSKKYRNKLQIQNLVRPKMEDERWTLAIQLPEGARDSFCNTFGISRENVDEWKQTKQGMQAAESATVRGLTDYFSARSRGQKSVKNFFHPVTTDLSGISSRQVSRTLTDLSDRFRSYDVDKEQAVQEFVERKTRGLYVIGSAFYQLTKAEKVQPNKAVVIMEKGKSLVWGGGEARQLIGLPIDGVTEARVTPGNHSKYDIFVQSTSVNRKLVRGTKLLLDVELKRGMKPTWDHTAVNT